MRKFKDKYEVYVPNYKDSHLCEPKSRHTWRYLKKNTYRCLVCGSFKYTGELAKSMSINKFTIF